MDLNCHKIKSHVAQSGFSREWPEYIQHQFYTLDIFLQYFNISSPGRYFSITRRESLNLSVTPTTLYTFSTVSMASPIISLCDIPGLEHSQKYRIWSSWLRPPCPTLITTTCFFRHKYKIFTKHSVSLFVTHSLKDFVNHDCLGAVCAKNIF